MIALLAALAGASETAVATVVAPEVLLGVGPGLGAGDGGSLGGSAGVVAAWFPTRRVGVQAVVREGYWAGAPRLVGQIGFAPRWRASERVDLWTGFVHHHETPLAVARGEPIGSVAGTAHGIRHRTGADLGLSYGVPLGRARANLAGVGRLDLTTSIFPDAAGPQLYGQVWLTVALEVRALRRGA